MTQSAEHLVRNIGQLTSFPDIAFRINDMVSDTNSSAADIATLIETDPAFSSVLLRIANSAMYNVGGSVSTAERAVTVIGVREIRNVAFGICATRAFDGISNELISVEDFWKHSLYCAVASQELGRLAGINHGESLFTAGLLHDIGHLAMFNQEPELSSRALQLSIDENDGLSPYLSERKIFRYDHMDVGGQLARQWGFPRALRQCIETHHEPFADDVNHREALVVHVANSIAVLAELDSRDWADAPSIDERAFSELRIDEALIPGLVTDTRQSVDELLHIFVG